MSAAPNHHKKPSFFHRVRCSKSSQKAFFFFMGKMVKIAK
jgi:hypothetical protein